MNDVLQFSLLLEIFLIKKKFEVLSLASYGTLNYDCIIKTIEMLRFLPLINSLVTIGLSFLLLLISTIISSKTINTLCFLPRLYFSIFL